MRKRRVAFHAAAFFPHAGTLVLLLGIAILPGCGKGDRPPLGTVHGRITLDGKPLSGARIGFVPKEAGRESSGITDAEGNYELKYLRDAMGAKVGGHKVSISTAHDRARTTETVPAKYNVNSTLEKQVAAGDNVIDFELTTR
jgi:hypothetical protein